MKPPRPTLAVNKDSVLASPSHRREHGSIFRMCRPTSIWAVLFTLKNAKPFISNGIGGGFSVMYSSIVLHELWYIYKIHFGQKIKHLN